MTDKQFNYAYKQHVTKFEGEDELSAAFDNFLVQDNDEDNDDFDLPLRGTEIEFTSFDRNAFARTFESLTIKLCNRSFLYKMTEQGPQPQDKDTKEVNTFTNQLTSRYDSNQFFGVCVNTRALTYSTGGYGQFQALQCYDNIVQLDTFIKGNVIATFGKGSALSIGSVKLKLLISVVTFYIVNAKIPFLLCFKDIDRLQVYINNLENAIILKTNERVLVIRRFGYLFLLWDGLLQQFIVNSFDCNPCYLTDVELQRLHCRFGHPSINKLQRVLERARHKVKKGALEHLTKFCD